MNLLSEGLSVLDRKQLKRSLRVFEQVDGARLQKQGKTLLNFSSNNYLGLSRHPQVLEAVRQVLDHWGTGATSSRLISGTSVIHQDLEMALAAFMKKEAALVFPAGYMTNLGVLTALSSPGDAVVMDRLCHASLIDAVRLSGARLFVYRHADLEDAERALKRAVSYRRRLLVTDSLFSMDGDFAPLEALSRLARRHEAISIVDEAHALGVWGPEGRGARFMAEKETSFPHAVSGNWDVVVGTLSKALGSQGGFACGSQVLIDTLVNKARSFIYTTGLSPACVAAAHASLSLIQEDPGPREHLQRLSEKLRKQLLAMGFNILNSQSQIVPILLGGASEALVCAERLEASGIFAPAIRPPTVPSGQCRIRFSITAEHQEADIERLLEVLRHQ